MLCTSNNFQIKHSLQIVIKTSFPLTGMEIQLQQHVMFTPKLIRLH